VASEQLKSYYGSDSQILLNNSYLDSVFRDIKSRDVKYGEEYLTELCFGDSINNPNL
jgi:hypothetical protein